jgi:2-dehydropantoate 2-reductase
MAVPFPTIGIVGSGAIGTYFGARLGIAGADVRFLMRGDLAAVKARGSVVIRSPSGTAELSPVSVYGSPAEIGPVDLVIVALKTTSRAETGSLVGPLLGPRTSVLTLQNGLGADEFLGELFGAGRIVGGLVFMASTRTAPGEVTCFNTGTVSLGELGRPPGEQALAVAGQLASAGVRVTVVESLIEARWRKLVWNIPFNGISVAEGAATDRICADAALAGEVRALMREVQWAASGFGFDIPDDFLRRQFERTPAMGPYQPSSLVDYRAGREVEVEAIWGEPLRRARAAGVETPRLAALYSRLRAMCPGPRPPLIP